MKPELDVWAPGEHNGTFRGHCPAFVTATAALDFWTDDALEMAVRKKSRLISKRLQSLVQDLGLEADVRGRGMIWGVEFADRLLAGKVSQTCFERGLVVETAGIDDQVLKLLPSLTIDEADLVHGLDIIEQSLITVLQDSTEGVH
jgi:diaminobutyrate-2-oxoglutarate transaminase